MLHYNDLPAGSPEFYSGFNVSRKIQNGSLFPLYVAPGVDITKELVDTLNESYRKSKSDE